MHTGPGDDDQDGDREDREDDPLLEELADRGFAALHAEEPEEALAIGRTLARAGHIVGYELQALALGELERPDEAVAVLRRAVEQSPGDWRPRRMLGNLLSDLGRHDDALEAFDAALGCPGVDTAAVQCNASVCLARAERPFEALQRLEDVDDPTYWLRAGVQRARLCIELERYGEALNLAERLRDELTDRLANGAEAGDAAEDDDALDADEPGYLLATLAIARWRATGDHAAAVADARAALDYDPVNEGALWAWRELHDRRPPGVSGLSLIVHGTGTAPDGTAAEFLQRFEVMAAGPGGALELIREIEPDSALRDSLTVDGYEPIDDLGDGRAGVFYASDRQWFDPEG
ncbi:MAG: tetratricopeptide repeat protein [Planctomycetota bacterium]|jgi:tetratricopeptide (TPR) repeat protein